MNCHQGEYTPPVKTHFFSTHRHRGSSISHVLPGRIRERLSPASSPFFKPAGGGQRLAPLLNYRPAISVSRVEMWRGGLGGACLFPPLSSVGASISPPCSVSTSRSSNRTGGFPASGSRTRFHAFAHGRSCVRFGKFNNPKTSCRYWSE